MNDILTVKKITDELIKTAEKAGFNITKDSFDNILLFKKDIEGSKKICFNFVFNLNRIMIKEVNDNVAEFVSENQNTSFIDREVYFNSESIGIVRKAKEDTQNIELFTDNSLKIGDVCYTKQELKCKGNLLYGFNAIPEITLDFVQKLILKQIKSVKEIYFTISFCNKNIPILEKIHFDEIYTVAFAAEYKNFKCGSGCASVIKDGFYVTDEKLIAKINESANNSKITIQNYVGKHSAFLEKISLHNRGALCGGIYIPVSHYQSGCEVIQKNDIESADMLINSLMERVD